MKAQLVIVGLLCVASTLYSAEYYVEKGGDDGNPGSRMRPFKSIQKAASVMVAGDVCTVSRGLYREAVRPAHSGKADLPIIIKAAAGETVTLSGADEQIGWIPLPNGGFKAKSKTPIQVLVDEMPAVQVSAVLDEVNVNKPVWYFNASEEMLYLRLSQNETPLQHGVQIQTRLWGLDVSGLSHVEFRGLNLFACAISLNNARSCKIDDCHLWWSNGTDDQIATNSNGTLTDSCHAAIMVGGKENEVVNCSVIGNTGYGIVVLEGSLNNTVENCLLRGVDSFDRNASGILAQGTAPLIRNVSVFNYSGSALVCSNVLNARIENNDFHHTGSGCTNRGMVALTGDGMGTVLAFNWIHDNLASGGNGIVFEGPVENYVVRQNVVWSHPGSAITFGSPCRYNFVFNNTCAINGGGIDALVSGKELDLKETRVINNIFAGSVWPSLGSKLPQRLIWRNNYVGSAPGFIDEKNRNFHLAKGSPCIDVGQEEPELTDEYSGKLPDMGAYEFGKEYAVPGCHVNEGANKVMTPVVKLLLESETPGAEIHYTLDGRIPDMNSPVYTGAVPVVYGAVVKIKAFRSGMEESATSSCEIRRFE